MKRLISITLVFLFAISTLTACNEVFDKNSNESSITTIPNDISMDISSTSKDSSNEHSDTVSKSENEIFTKTTFIKCSDASQEPKYESVYKFNIDGTMIYSKNMLEGFFQSKAKYIIRNIKGKEDYQILYYHNDKNANAEVLFTVNINDKITNISSAPTSFIDEDEFNTTYTFQAEWNANVIED